MSSIDLPLLGAILHHFLCFQTVFLSTAFCLFLFLTLQWIPLLLYLGWYLYDRESSRRGAYPSRWVRRLACFRWFNKYFPVKVHKTAELPPNKNYLIGYHPHGIISMGAHATFAMETGLDEVFPGLKWRLCTLVCNFFVPIRREIMLLMGFVDCSRESISYVLSLPDSGNALVLVTGGAEEALDARPGSNILALNNRKGFCRLALQTGASLVPVYAFGENDIYDQIPNPPGSFVRRFQQWTKKNFGVSSPFFFGRGIFLPIGLLPFRRPINIHFGAPLEVQKVENPSQEEVNSLHLSYISALRTLFDEHKSEYGLENESLIIR